MRIEIWSDIVCPWCAIGKAHLDAALAEFEHADDVGVIWRSYELDPGAPRVREGDYGHMLAHKYGTSVAAGWSMVDQMTGKAAESGLEFHLDRARPGNSFDAHRLVHLAADHGLQLAAKHRFLHAYLSEGTAIGDPEALEPLAVEIGLDRDDVRRVLESDAYAEAVRADEDEGLRLGLTGVPLFLVDRKFALAGAQPTSVMLETLRRAWQDSHGLVTVAGNGETCGPDGC